jgi:predicted DNA-binding WGR domain protein
MQLDLFPADVRLQCIDPAKNKRRFYVMKIQPNLFGEWELVREWGRIGAGGRVRRDAYPSAGLALGVLISIRQCKLARYYVSTDSTPRFAPQR